MTAEIFPPTGPRDDDPTEPFTKPGSTTTPSTTARPRHLPVRVGTVVWGLVVIAFGVLVLTVAGGAEVDGGAVAIGLLGGAGLALVLGSVLAGVRRHRHGRPLD